MFITGPDVIKTVTGEDVTMEELGGATPIWASPAPPTTWPPASWDAFDYVRDLLSFLPPNNYAEPPRLRRRRRTRVRSRTTSPRRTSNSTP